MRLRFFPACLLLGVLFASMTTGPALGQLGFNDLIYEQVQAACTFLENLYNSTLGLVESYPQSHVYYVASDNLLASSALQDCSYEQAKLIGQNITRTISLCCGNGDDLMHESLLGTNIPLPMHNATILTIANSTTDKLFHSTTATDAGGNYTVLWERHNGPGILPDCKYGDVTVYMALQLNRDQNATGTQHEMDCLNKMYDGRGIADEAYNSTTSSEHGVYQTYKLALYLYALYNISHTYNFTTIDTLLFTQGPGNGFHTGYLATGRYDNMTYENTETTSIAMITLTSLNPPGPSENSSLFYIIIGLVVAAIAAVILVLWIRIRAKFLTST
jgi:hypothetical protein